MCNLSAFSTAGLNLLFQLSNVFTLLSTVQKYALLSAVANLLNCSLNGIVLSNVYTFHSGVVLACLGINFRLSKLLLTISFSVYVLSLNNLVGHKRTSVCSPCSFCQTCTFLISHCVG